jgi:hypothetical protein
MPNRLTAILLFILAILLLSGSSAAYRHSANGAMKYITFDHQLHRVLKRAERDNLRTASLAKEHEERPTSHRAEQVSEVPPPRVVVTDDQALFGQLLLRGSNRLVQNSSSVLNL